MANVRSITPNVPANFTPEMGNYKTLQPFRYWCQKVLPLVYDDSLSYYELLCKVVDYLNKTMEDVETLHGDVTDLHAAYEELQSYVNDYFSTLDVQEEINNKLDVMASNGTLLEIIAPTISESVRTWLQKNITQPTTPVIDKSLTVAGAGADAYQTGSLINSLFSPNNTALRKNLGSGTTFTDGYYLDSAGVTHVNADYSYSDYIEVEGRTLLSTAITGDDLFICAYTKDKEFVVGYYSNEPKSFNLLDNIKYIRYSLKTAIKYSLALINPLYLINEMLANYSYSGLYNKNITLLNDYCLKGYYCDHSNGKLHSNEKYMVSPFIRTINCNVVANTVFEINNEFFVCFYDKDKNYISGNFNTVINKTPENAYYFSYSVPINTSFNVVLTPKSTTLTVSKDGSKMFTSILSAVNYAYLLESKDNPITIIVYPGKYEEVLFIKGNHYISIVGVNRDTCILINESALYNNAPLRIQGACYIANMSFISTANKYISETGTGFKAWKTDVINGIKNPEWLGTIGAYAVHCDDTTNGEETTSLFYNCYMYSETLPAFGSGMQINNKIYLLNCDIISNIDADVYSKKLNNSQGALLVHGYFPTSGMSDPNQSLIVKNCNIKGINARCVNMYPSPNAPKASIEFIQNNFDNNHTSELDDLLSFTFDTKYIEQNSSGNNIEFFNKKLSQF